MQRSWLITGGSGFLGRHLTRALLDRGAERICIFSRSESRQAEMRADIPDPDARLRWFIGDVRDRHRMEWAMRDVDVVVHAAALKRIEVGAYAPTEMVETNVRGTVNVIDAAASVGVEKVIYVSTDKAWQPVSPYGQSKALAESLMRAANIERRGPKYTVIRYGNVWWSTGSVAPIWKSMIARGARQVPVTDLNCTRFFMTIDAAVGLVLRTVQTMKGGELSLPSGLKAYTLAELVCAFGIEPNIIGLPEHEKLHEGLSERLTSDKAERLDWKQLRIAIDKEEHPWQTPTP